jgi:hypothetical protein
MPILDAALAFTLTMLIVSTVVTALIGFVQTLAGVRKTVMKEMLEEYYKTELLPVIKREMVRLKNVVDQNTATQLEQLADKTDTSKLFSDVEMKKLVDASTAEITERLKRSPLGTELMTKLGAEAEFVFNELGKRYEAVGEKFTLSFRNNSRWWASGVALILALVLNIDSIFIMDSYIKNQGLRDVVIAQRDTFEQNYKDLVSSFDAQDDTVTKEEVEKAFSESQDQITTLTSVGLPLGWKYFPHVGWKDSAAEEYTSRDNSRGWTFWVLGILLTAGLAGLGGPFWYDAVAGVSRAADNARKGKKNQEE